MGDLPGRQEACKRVRLCRGEAGGGGYRRRGGGGDGNEEGQIMRWERRDRERTCTEGALRNSLFLTLSLSLWLAVSHTHSLCLFFCVVVFSPLLCVLTKIVCVFFFGIVCQYFFISIKK